MAQDFVLLPSAKEIEFFRKREDAVLINRGHGGGYWSRYDVNAIAFDGFKIDSMRIYTDEFATKLSAYARGIIGLNGLTYFLTSAHDRSDCSRSGISAELSIIFPKDSIFQ